MSNEDVPSYEVITATSPAQVHALSHATRHRLLQALGPDGATVSQLANRLSLNKGNVTHHLDVLVRAGLARKGATRTVRGGTEQYFVKTARKYRFDSGEDGETTAAVFATITEDLTADDDHLLHHRVLRLTAAQACTLQRHLESVVDNLASANPREAEYGVLVGFYRRR